MEMPICVRKNLSGIIVGMFINFSNLEYLHESEKAMRHVI